ncbi:MAG: hypothetical protein M1818_005295 [Claussenomyces sp. TS43310]|nr:MAG: hypothetical protein M1818_005295 [Claussenomyces sp. TS43310]
MPYNTRRKSLSLPSLGIHLPVTHASRAAARSPPSTTPPSDQPPTKKIKRSHGSKSPSPMSPPAKPVIVKYEHTPPPSPHAVEAHEGAEVEAEEEGQEQENHEPHIRREIDLEGINDEIVEAVVVRLHESDNRPHLVKELAAILTTSVKIVESSANPSAIISSRLSTYLKRPCWSALAPCPLAKELETVHPRRTYFYLTTYPHQPIPDPAQTAAAAGALRNAQRSIISPSLSSTASRSDEAETERRRELSPSPEVDLSSPEFDEMDDVNVAPPTPTGSFSGRLTKLEPTASSVLRNHRSASPPLEKDEKEFTQTARGMQKRKLSSAMDAQPAAPSAVENAIHIHLDGDLFGNDRGHAISHGAYPSSPAFKPAIALSAMHPKKGLEEMNGPEMWEKFEAQVEWDTRSPENIELDELDDMFDCF